MSVWITRSAPDNLRTARAIRGLGRRPLMVPVLTTRPLSQPAIGSLPDAVIFTSVHAVRHYAHHDQISSIPVFVASGLIADAATAAGYTTVVSTAGNEDALPDLMSHVLIPHARVMILCAERSSSRLSDHLRVLGHHVERRAVYEPISADDGPLEHIRRGIHRVSTIVVHSRRGAERIAPIVGEEGWRGSLWCISRHAAAAFEGLRRPQVCIAAQPTEHSLLELSVRLSSPRARMRPMPSASAACTLISAAGALQPPSRTAPQNDNYSCFSHPGDEPEPPAA